MTPEKLAEFDVAAVRAENDQLRRLLIELRRAAKEALHAMEREAWEAGKSICRGMQDLTEAERDAGQVRGEAEYRMLLQRFYLEKKAAAQRAERAEAELKKWQHWYGETYKAWLAERTGRLCGQQLSVEEMYEMRRRADRVYEEASAALSPAPAPAPGGAE